MVKQYDLQVFGEDTNYDLRVYNPTAAWPGKVVGVVRDTSENGIGGAFVKAEIVSASAITLPNGYYLLILPSGTYTITVSADGFEAQSQSEVAVGELNAATLNFTMVSSPQGTKGDINGDGNVNLTDAILCLRVLAGLDTSGLLRSDYGTSGTDVNGDNSIGIEEVIYILQKVSEKRS